MSKDKYIICIIGMSASGKDTIARILAKQYNYKYVVSTTSRPMRSNETNHQDYHFITADEFEILQANDKLIEYRYYDTLEGSKKTRWHYGIERSEIDLNTNDYVCVVDLVGLKDLKAEFGCSVISIYVESSEEERRTRAIGRDINFEEDEWIRRNADDDIKFANVKEEVDEIISNRDLHKCVGEVIKYVDKEKKKRTFFEQYASY